MVPGAVPPPELKLKMAPSNKGIHPTRVGVPLIVSSGGFGVVSGRVMPGVRTA